MYLRQHSGQFLCRFFDIVIRLQAHPESTARAEECSQTQCRIRRDFLLTQNYCDADPISSFLFTLSQARQFFSSLDI